MSNELEPVNGRHLPHGFSDDVVERALTLMLETQSIHQAQRYLEQEMLAQDKNALVPAYDTFLMWARQREGVNHAIHADRKRDMVAVSSDAAMAWGQRSLEAAQAKDENGKYVVTHRESAYHYGIAMQRRTDWESAGSKGNQLNVQFNLTSGGQSIKEGDGGA